MGPLLQKINSPDDVKRLSKEQLPQLAREVRDYILEVISVNGGHLGAALGSVDLTIALHTCFSTPEDTVVWDVGHQVHAHKILTGRRDAFKTFRLPGGLSGFSNKDESKHDPFTTGHGGASISTALGIAVANRMKSQNRKVIAVIGDASIVSGMAFEAMNHAGHLKDNLIVILNDNEMSISPTVGAFSRYLNRIISSPFYNHVRKDITGMIQRIPKVGERMVKKAKKIDEGVKNLFLPGLLFEELGFRYFGPLDGHDINGLIEIFENVSKIDGPVFMHIVTKKGKGYDIAEKDPQRWHASTPFDIQTGVVKKTSSARTYTQTFGETAVRLAEKNKNVAAITAAMCEGTGLVDFMKRFPERFFDVGIAEEHGVAFAAGLAKAGVRPVVAIYSTFLQRAHDQILHDVSLQDLPVVFCLDRAGLVGEDGPTHHGAFDLSYLRKVPGMALLAPRDGRELDQMMEFAVNKLEGSTAIRYPRGAVAEETGGPLKDVIPAPIYLGKAEELRDGRDVLILAVGSMVYPAYEAALLLEKDGISAGVLNARFVKPLDEDAIRRYSEGRKLVLTAEEGTLVGGFGSGILELFEKWKAAGIQNVPLVRRLGIPDQFVEHGKREVLLDNLGLSAPRMRDEIIRLLNAKKGANGAHGVGEFKAQVAEETR